MLKTMKIIKLFFAILLAIFTNCQNSLYAQVLLQDSLALVAFYNSTGGPNWNNNTGWLTGQVSTWYGISIKGNRVSKLIMYNNNLNGYIPSDIGTLNNLTDLALGYEPMLNSVIPQEIGQMIKLKALFIGNCAIIGTIPNEIGNCVNIHSIELFENSLTGSIPTEISNIESLVILDLHDNQLNGSIPPEIGNCTQLSTLRLNNNQLSGSIPAALARCNQIQTLYLSNNNLIGEIPAELSAVSSYVSLDFSTNHLTGIPPWTTNWLLTDLAIGGNCMTFEDLEPHFVGYMWYNYYPQDSMQTVIDTLLPKGSNYNIYSGCLGQYTTYYWFHNGVYMQGPDNIDTLKLFNISEADAGVYTCNAQSSKFKEPNGMPMVLFRRKVTIGITVGVQELTTQNRMTVYPNPCTENLKIETSEPIHDGTVSITNGYGQLLKQITWENDNTKQTVSLGDLPQGVYMLSLHDKSHWFTHKIILN